MKNVKSTSNRNQFALQPISLSFNVIILDDVVKEFNFKSLFNKITKTK